MHRHRVFLARRLPNATLRLLSAPCCTALCCAALGAQCESESLPEVRGGLGCVCMCVCCMLVRMRRFFACFHAKLPPRRLCPLTVTAEMTAEAASAPPTAA